MDISSESNKELQILEVAERLFLEYGFAATSTTQIAREVGCNQALVHYYFRTKENLFNSIFEHKFCEFFSALFTAISMKEMSFEEKLTRLIQSHFDLLQRNPKIPFLIINEFSRQPERILSLFEKLQTIPQAFFVDLEKELQTEIDEGRIRKISFSDLIISMISLNMSQLIMLQLLGKLPQFKAMNFEYMIMHRKAENVDFVLKSLRP